ncbi:hypothetical protein CLIB1423_02S09714 [[Candida] railenensis]|uniref:F-box domain-containing protein n=1 Tax=[Candida] railenensis TaxID=45579 RepID=A0A9P0VX23_9ASCO|nr:hypothetical protein CLIB1423_02S09714 [[Candida] railenensis]
MEERHANYDELLNDLSPENTFEEYSLKSTMSNEELPLSAPSVNSTSQRSLLLLSEHIPNEKHEIDVNLGFGEEEEVKRKQISPSSINTLPPEILLKIFSYLDPVTLTEIWRVCKRWKLLAQTKEIWYKSFSNEFNTQESFPSISNSKLWILEYEDRLLARRKWAKSRLTSQYYKFMSERFVSIPSLKVDFESKKLTGLLDNGEYGSCNLINGKSYSYIPNRPFFTHKTPKYNSQYLVQILAEDDSIWVKKLQAAKSSGSSIKSSVRCEGDSLSAQNCLDICDGGYNQDYFVSGDVSGFLMCWNFKGKLIKKYKLSEFPIIFVKFDYRNKFIAIDSKKNIYYVNREEGKVHSQFSLSEEYEFSDLDTLDSNFSDAYGSRWWVEVDFGFDKVIFMHGSKIIIVDYIESKLFKSLELQCPIRGGEIQTTRPLKLIKYDKTIAGSDGILYSNLLSDNSVLVWNIRDDRAGKTIIPQCHFKTQFGKREEVTSMALNSSVLILGYRNGFSEVHDVFTGERIRNCTKDFPKNFEHYYHGCPTHKILLNPDPLMPNGVIITYDLVQYFQFGELPDDKEKRRKGKLNKSIHGQKLSNRNIKIELEEYDRQEEEKKEAQRLISKFNGDFMNEPILDDNENDISLALAVSQSESESYKNLNDEEQLKLALELSLNATNSGGSASIEEIQSNEDVLSNEFSQQLAEALRLSLEDHQK